MAIVERKVWRMLRAVPRGTGAWSHRMGILFVALVAASGTGCSQGYKESVIPAKEFTPLARARKMLEGYAAGDPVGSDFMGFAALREELRLKNADPSGIVGEAFAEIEKSMKSPAQVKAIAQKALAELDKPSAP